jgi:hypothetical protein
MAILPVLAEGLFFAPIINNHKQVPISPRLAGILI